MARFYQPTQARPIDYGYELDWRPFAAGAQHAVDSADKYGEAMGKMNEIFSTLKVTRADQPLLEQKLAPYKQQAAQLAEDYAQGKYNPATPKGRMQLSALTQGVGGIANDPEVMALLNTYQAATAQREAVLSAPDQYDSDVSDIVNKAYDVIGTTVDPNGTMRANFMAAAPKKFDKAGLAFKLGQDVRVDEQLRSQGYKIITDPSGIKLLKQGSRLTETVSEKELMDILGPLLDNNEEIQSHEAFFKWGIKNGVADPGVLDAWNNQKKEIVRLTAKALGISNIKEDEQFSVIGGQGDNSGSTATPSITTTSPKQQMDPTQTALTKAVYAETARTLDQLDKNRDPNDSGYGLGDELRNMLKAVVADPNAKVTYPAEQFYTGGDQTQQIVQNLGNNSNYDWGMKHVPHPTEMVDLKIVLGRSERIDVVGATLSGQSVPVALSTPGTAGEVFDVDAAADQELKPQLNTYMTTQNNVFNALRGKEISLEDAVRFFPQFTTDKDAGPALIDADKINTLKKEFEAYVSRPGVYSDAERNDMISNYNQSMNSLLQMIEVGRRNPKGGVTPTHLALGRKLISTEKAKGITAMGIDGRLGYGGNLKIGDQAIKYQYSQNDTQSVGDKAEIAAMNAISAIRRPFNIVNNMADPETIKRALYRTHNPDGTRIKVQTRDANGNLVSKDGGMYEGIPITDSYTDYEGGGKWAKPVGIVTWDYTTNTVQINFDNGEVHKMSSEEYIGELEADYKDAVQNGKGAEFLKRTGMARYQYGY